MCRLFGQSRHQGGRQAASVATYNEHDSYLRQWRRLTPSQREEQWYCFRAGSSVRRLLVSCKTDPTLRRAGILHKCAHSRGRLLFWPFLLSLPPPPFLPSLPPTSSLPSFSLARPLHRFFSNTNFLDCDPEDGRDALCARGFPIDSAPLQR